MTSDVVNPLQHVSAALANSQPHGSAAFAVGQSLAVGQASVGGSWYGEGADAYSELLTKITKIVDQLIEDLKNIAKFLESIAATIDAANNIWKMILGIVLGIVASVLTMFLGPEVFAGFGAILNVLRVTVQGFLGIGRGVAGGIGEGTVAGGTLGESVGEGVGSGLSTIIEETEEELAAFNGEVAGAGRNWLGDVLGDIDGSGSLGLDDLIEQITGDGSILKSLGEGAGEGAGEGLGAFRLTWNGIKIAGYHAGTNGAAQAFVDAINHWIQGTKWTWEDLAIVMGSMLGFPEAYVLDVGLRGIIGAAGRQFLDDQRLFTQMLTQLEGTGLGYGTAFGIGNAGSHHVPFSWEQLLIDLGGAIALGPLEFWGAHGFEKVLPKYRKWMFHGGDRPGFGKEWEWKKWWEHEKNWTDHIFPPAFKKPDKYFKQSPFKFGSHTIVYTGDGYGGGAASGEGPFHLDHVEPLIQEPVPIIGTHRPTDVVTPHGPASHIGHVGRPPRLPYAPQGEPVPGAPPGTEWPPPGAVWPPPGEAWPLPGTAAVQSTVPLAGPVTDVPVVDWVSELDRVERAIPALPVVSHA